MSRLPEVTSFPASLLIHDLAAWPSLRRWGVAALVMLGVWAASALWSPAQASHVNWSIGINVPGGAMVVGEHRPIAVYPAPVYRSHTYPVYPAPVYPSFPYPAVTYPAYPVAVYPPPARVYDYAPRVHAPRHRHPGHHDRYDRYDHNGRYPDQHRNPYSHGGSRHWDDGRGRWDRR